MSSQKQEEIKEFGSTKPKKDIQIVSIIGQIEGHNLLGPQTKATKYEHIIPLLTDAEQDDAIKGILLILNTAGGDVEAGLALAELVRGMRKPSVSLVLGGGHSIGVPDGGFGRLFLYRADSQHDSAPPAQQWSFYHFAGEFCIFS